MEENELIEPFGQSIFMQKMGQDGTKNNNSTPTIMENDSFLPGYLSKNLGRYVKLELLIGGKLESRVGQLIKVGINFAVIKLNTNPISTVICNMDTIKIITVLYSGKNI